MINELTETINDLSEIVKRQNEQLKVLEERILKKPGRKKEKFTYMCEELTDERIIELINSGEFKTIGEWKKKLEQRKINLGTVM